MRKKREVSGGSDALNVCSVKRWFSARKRFAVCSVSPRRGVGRWKTRWMLLPQQACQIEIRGQPGQPVLHLLRQLFRLAASIRGEPRHASPQLDVRNRGRFNRFP